MPLSTHRPFGHGRRLAYLSISHQSQFPAVTLSFNLAPGVALGQAVDAINKGPGVRWAGCRRRCPVRSRARPGIPGDSLTQPYLIAAALVAVYIVLGLLYESYIHPLTILSTLPSAGVGALLILMAGRLRPRP